MTTLAVLMFAVGAGAFMLSKARIFSPLRQAVIKRKAPSAPHKRFWSWVNELLNCPFCVSVWLSAGAVGVYHPRVVHEWFPVDLLTETLAVSGGSMLIVLIIRKALEA